MKFVVAMGTRPEAVKLAPVVSALMARAAQVITVATSQHRGLLAQALQVFGIVPDRDLNVMQPQQRLADFSARILAAFTDLLQEERPDAVMDPRNAATTFICALAAFTRRCRSRTSRRGCAATRSVSNPFPEGRATVVSPRRFRGGTSRRPSARERILFRERTPDERVLTITGNTVVDALEMQSWHRTSSHGLRSIARRARPEKHSRHAASS